MCWPIEWRKGKREADVIALYGIGCASREVWERLGWTAPDTHTNPLGYLWWRWGSE